MKSLLPIAAILCTGLTTLLMLVFHVAGAANASKEQIRSMQLWAGGLTVLALVGVVAGVLLMRAGQTGWAAATAFLPTVIMTALFLLAVLQ